MTVASAPRLHGVDERHHGVGALGVHERRRDELAQPSGLGFGRRGAQDRASPKFMGLASLGLHIGICGDLPYSVLPLYSIWGLDFLGRAPSRPQVGAWLFRWALGLRLADGTLGSPGPGRVCH